MGAPTITKRWCFHAAARSSWSGSLREDGAELVKEAVRPDDVAGASTTTATVLAQALVREGLRNVAAGANPRPGSAVSRRLQAITESLPVGQGYRDHDQIAATAASPPVTRPSATWIAEATDKVANGVITVEESNTFGLQLELFTEGMRFDKGHPLLRDRRRASGSRPGGSLHPGPSARRSRPSRICCPCWEKSHPVRKPLLIIVEGRRGRSPPPWWSTRSAAPFKAVAVKAPGFGDRRKAMLQDMAILTGGQVISERGRSVARDR